MRFVKLCSLFACGGVLGMLFSQLSAAEPAETIERQIQAKDFWNETGAKLTHESISGRDGGTLGQLAGTATSAVVRLRALKLLDDLGGRTRYGKDFSEQQSVEAVAGVFQHLEQHLSDATVAKFRPELGFTHVTLSKRSEDQDGVWLLIESSDGILPSGGLNLRWNPATKSVDHVEHWGADRSPAQPTGG